jgi:cation diffusion facilitator CzcD-associated flavoprotein CzcO
MSDKYSVTSHICFRTSFDGARWDEETSTWTVQLTDLTNNIPRFDTVDILILAVGGLVTPKPSPVSATAFKGQIFHSAKWDHGVSLEGKNVVVVGNGCSASQIIPAILPQTTSLVQFIRSPQWYVKSGNFRYPAWTKFLFKWIPGALLLWRFVFSLD